MLDYNITIVIVSLIFVNWGKVMDEQIKQIVDFWLSNTVLERFKVSGDKYMEQIEEAKNEEFRINQKPLRITR